jgi:hypothetical protein
VDPDIYPVAHCLNDRHADRVADSDKYADAEHGHIYKDRYTDIHKYRDADRDRDQYAVTAKHTDKFTHVNIYGDKVFNAHCYQHIDQSAVPDLYRNPDIYGNQDRDADIHRHFHGDAVTELNCVLYSDFHRYVNLHPDFDRHCNAVIHNN